MNDIRPAGLLQRLFLLFDLLVRYRIEGDSMLPVLRHGEEVLVREKARIAVGDIVIARHPFKESVEMAKRITGIDANGKYFLVGDNSEESTDSRSFGPVPEGCILGKVVYRLGRPSSL